MTSVKGIFILTDIVVQQINASGIQRDGQIPLLEWEIADYISYFIE